MQIIQELSNIGIFVKYINFKCTPIKVTFSDPNPLQIDNPKDLKAKVGRFSQFFKTDAFENLIIDSDRNEPFDNI